MIHSSTINTVYSLADMFESRGMKITPIPTTPVAQLLEACHYELPTQGYEEGLLDPVDLLQKGSSTPGPDGVVRHDIVMDEMVDVIAETVKGNLHIARNVVNPIIKEVVADLQSHMQVAENMLQPNISIIPDFFENVWNTSTFDAMIERYSQIPIQTVNLRHRIPFEQSFSVQTHLHTGSQTFDEDIDQIVESMGMDKVIHTGSLVFGGLPDRQGVLQNVLSSMSRNQVLIVHLMARRLIDNPPEGTTIALSQYNEYLANIVAQSGRMLSILRQRRLRNQNQNLLVNEWPMGRDEVGKRTIQIHVNGDLYNKFLEEGGSPEIVIGAFITDQMRQVPTLLEKKEFYETAWEKHYRVLVTSQRLNRFNHAVEGLRQAVARQINELDEEDIPVTRDVLHRKLQKNLSALYGHWYEKPYEYARKVVCETLFPHTMALQILCAIDHVCDDHPGIEVREAAFLATIEIVSAWVAKLCHVEHLSS